MNTFLQLFHFANIHIQRLLRADDLCAWSSLLVFQFILEIYFFVVRHLDFTKLNVQRDSFDHAYMPPSVLQRPHLYANTENDIANEFHFH